MPIPRRTGQAEQALREQVRAALAEARISQASACRQLDLSTKHLSHMLTGRAPLTLDWAEKIVALCDKRIEVLVLTGPHTT
ncbi:helix-turn-helix transcriptional regulator [Streptomyces sp. DH12]|uniref:helix-turn-helix domain-containing protein n=1 Tax=Streptomyces sp. DH12 TaxID=2857010 RepID=UPI001E65A456|nr:helix-turn-helix transcriptional regulator [Streptomyces sp. DH12]